MTESGISWWLSIESIGHAGIQGDLHFPGVPWTERRIPIRLVWKWKKYYWKLDTNSNPIESIKKFFLLIKLILAILLWSLWPESLYFSHDVLYITQCAWTPFLCLFLAMSLPDFYRYNHGYDKDHIDLNVRGKYYKFSFTESMEYGMKELFRYNNVTLHLAWCTIPLSLSMASSYCYNNRSNKKRVMVPPVVADINKDCVEYILMTAFDGTMILFRGDTLAIKWKIEFYAKRLTGKLFNIIATYFYLSW